MAKRTRKKRGALGASQRKKKPARRPRGAPGWNHLLGGLFATSRSSQHATRSRRSPASPAELKPFAFLGRFAAAEPEVKAEAPALVSLPSPAPALPQIVPAEPQSALTEAELIQPRGRLRDSVEGFLLDQRSEHTRKAYGRDLKRFVGFLLTAAAHGSADQAAQSKDSLSAVSRVTVIRFKDQLLADGLSHTTIDRHLATLKSFFRWLVEDGVLTRSPAESVKFLNPRKISTTQGFTDEEVRRVLTQPNLHTRTGALHYAVLMMLFFCGLRRSELCEIRTSQIRQERGQWVIRLRGKGNRERFVVMPPPVWRSLQHYFLITRRRLEDDQPLFWAIREQESTPLHAARPLDPSMIYYIVVRYAREAGIQSRVSPHSCRATAISNARDRHVPDRAIQEFAGWASTEMITRYDKRRTAIEQSASLTISYGDVERNLPRTVGMAPLEPPPHALNDQISSLSGDSETPASVELAGEPAAPEVLS